MAKRPETAKAQVGLRIAEPLRARLEDEARRHGRSLNEEMALRLLSSLYHSDQGSAVFTDEDIFATVDSIAQFVRIIEYDEKKKLRENFRNILQKAVDTVIQLVEAPKAGWPTGENSIRAEIDKAYSVLLEAQRLSKDAAPPAPPAAALAVEARLAQLGTVPLATESVKKSSGEGR